MPRSTYNSLNYRCCLSQVSIYFFITFFLLCNIYLSSAYYFFPSISYSLTVYIILLLIYEFVCSDNSRIRTIIVDLVTIAQ